MHLTWVYPAGSWEHCPLLGWQHTTRTACIPARPHLFLKSWSRVHLRDIHERQIVFWHLHRSNVTVVFHHISDQLNPNGRSLDLILVVCEDTAEEWWAGETTMLFNMINTIYWHLQYKHDRKQVGVYLLSDQLLYPNLSLLVCALTKFYFLLFSYK